MRGKTKIGTAASDKGGGPVVLDLAQRNLELQTFQKKSEQMYFILNTLPQMKQILSTIIITLLLFSCKSKLSNTKSFNNDQNIGLLIVDAQKWFIPGHPESLYKVWNITGHDRSSGSIISSMDSTLAWANSKKLPVFVTYEGQDTGSYDLPNELLEDLDSSRTTHYVKFFYGAPKHKDFNDQLQKSRINNWIIIGAETDVCVYQTAKELLKQGKRVTLINEAIYSGRNNTEVSRNNLAKFGAHFISLHELYLSKNLFVSNPSKVEAPIVFENSVLTVFPFTDDTNLNNGDSKRLEYLIKFAEITGLKIEKPNAITTEKRTRLLAGNITAENYKNLQSQTTDELIVLSDCTPALIFSEIPTEWHQQTLKTVFYELMETAKFYEDSIEDLQGWQKKLKKALNEETLPYVESLQNL